MSDPFDNLAREDEEFVYALEEAKARGYTPWLSRRPAPAHCEKCGGEFDEWGWCPVCEPPRTPAA